jgi:hypothetical protein
MYIKSTPSQPVASTILIQLDSRDMKYTSLIQRRLLGRIVKYPSQSLFLTLIVDLGDHWLCCMACSWQRFENQYQQ